jgi:hypothetical protein
MEPARLAQLRDELDRQARLAKRVTPADGGLLLRGADGGRPRGGWQTHRAPDGRRYYVHALDGRTSWETPPELRELHRWDHRKHAADIAVPADELE